MISGTNWAGDMIVRDTIMPDKRAVLGNSSIRIPTDIRAWLSSVKSEVIILALQEMGLPAAREAGTLTSVPGRYGITWLDLWSTSLTNSPADWTTSGSSRRRPSCCTEETARLAFLLATLLLASGVSEHCVRVALGSVALPGWILRPRLGGLPE